jgi:hypothetical protein
VHVCAQCKCNHKSNTCFAYVSEYTLHVTYAHLCTQSPVQSRYMAGIVAGLSKCEELGLRLSPEIEEAKVALQQLQREQEAVAALQDAIDRMDAKVRSRV